MSKNKNDYQSEASQKYIPISEIVIDDAFRVRECENKDTVGDYAEAFEQYKLQKAGGVEDAKYPFPAVHVWRRDGQYVLIAGFHRLLAARKAEKDTILVKEFIGDENSAFEFALKDNRKNGRRLSRGDLRVCIEKALIRNPDMSLTLISDMTGASRTRCHEVKKEMEQSPEYKNLFPKTTTGKGGKVQSAKQTKRKPKVSQESQEPGVVSTQEKPKVEPVQEELVVVAPALQEQDGAAPSSARRYGKHSKRKPTEEVTPEEPKGLSTPQEPPTESIALPTDDGDEFDFIRWERLESVEPTEQIKRFCHVLEVFEMKLESKGKEHKDRLYKKVDHWLAEKYIPSRQTRSTVP